MGGGKLRVQDSINRAASFLCGFGPAGSKDIERPAAACLAWIGRGENGWRPGIAVAKKHFPGFLLQRKPMPQRTRLH